MVIRTIRKEKENLPYQRQNVVGFFCVAKVGDSELFGVIKAEKRDDNGKKIAYQVELYAIPKPKLCCT